MPEDPATTPLNEEHLVRHRKRRRHSFRPESEALARRRQDLRALAWILPGCLLALGAVILLAEMRNPEPAARAKDVVAIGCALVGAGATLASFSATEVEGGGVRRSLRIDTSAALARPGPVLDLLARVPGVVAETVE